MAVLPLSKAAKAAGTSRQTIYRYAKQGRLSTVQLHDGSLGVDTAELLRVFGTLLQPETVAETVTSDSVRQGSDSLSHADTVALARLQAEVDGLRVAVGRLERQVEADQNREHKLLGIIESQTRLIEHQAQPNRTRPRWKKAAIAAAVGIAAALAWNAATKEKPPPNEAPTVQAPKQDTLERWHPDDDGG